MIETITSETIFQKALQIWRLYHYLSLCFSIKQKRRKNYNTKLELTWRLITLKLLEISTTNNAQWLFYIRTYFEYKPHKTSTKMSFQNKTKQKKLLKHISSKFDADERNNLIFFHPTQFFLLHHHSQHCLISNFPFVCQFL